MPGLLHITLTALLASCDAFRLASSQRVIPLSSARLLQDEGPAQASRFLQELVRAKRHSVQELVRAQPHLVHDMGWPEIHETSRSQGKMESANSSQLSAPARTQAAENLDVEEEMERMVHLAVPLDEGGFRGQPDSADPETELLGGTGAADASQEASGFYGTDLEDRERRGGEEEEEEKSEDDVLEAPEGNHTTPDLDSLIGYSPSFHPSSSQESSVSFPAEAQDSGLQEHRASPVLEVGPLERELWEAEGEEDVQSSGYGVLRSPVTSTETASVATVTSTAAAGDAGDAAGTATPETDTGTDFSLLGSYTKDVTEDEEAQRKEEEEEAGLTHLDVFTQNPTVPEVGLAPSREPLQPSVEEEEELEQGEHDSKVLKGKRPSQFQDRSEEEEEEEEEKWRKMNKEDTKIRHIIPLTTDPSPSVGFTYPDLSGMEKDQQVVCIDWTELSGRGYVILNMTQNMNCEDFRVFQGVRLLKIMEQVFARRMNSPEGSWVIYLSKPTHQQHQVLMNVATEHGVMATKDVLGLLGEIRKSLEMLGIESYSAASTCESRPSQTRSDYGKLFVVLVIIGSVCMVIITSGFIYICWQKRLPVSKTTFRAEELHFVENGCHDNPTLDVTNDGHPEMREKKPSTNGLAGGGEGGGEGAVAGRCLSIRRRRRRRKRSRTHTSDRRRGGHFLWTDGGKREMMGWKKRKRLLMEVKDVLSSQRSSAGGVTDVILDIRRSNFSLQ